MQTLENMLFLEPLQCLGAWQVSLVTLQESSILLVPYFR